MPWKPSELITQGQHFMLRLSIYALYSNVNYKYLVSCFVNVRVLGKGLELLSANCGRFEINQLLFADDTALVADSEEKLCRLLSEFGRVCERRKLRVTVGNSKVIRCSRYGNGDRMLVMLNGEPLEEGDCLKYLGSQVAANGGCERDVVHRMNEGYRAW